MSTQTPPDLRFGTITVKSPHNHLIYREGRGSVAYRRGMQVTSRRNQANRRRSLCTRSWPRSSVTLNCDSRGLSSWRRSGSKVVGRSPADSPVRHRRRVGRALMAPGSCSVGRSLTATPRGLYSTLLRAVIPPDPYTSALTGPTRRPALRSWLRCPPSSLLQCSSRFANRARG